jgi:hypothetical protein
MLNFLFIIFSILVTLAFVLVAWQYGLEAWKATRKNPGIDMKPYSAIPHATRQPCHHNFIPQNPSEPSQYNYCRKCKRYFPKPFEN